MTLNIASSRPANPKLDSLYVVTGNENSTCENST